MRLTRTLALTLALAGCALLGPDQGRFGDGGVPAFYRWSGPVPEAGKLLRNEALPASLVLPSASRGERILYSSTDGLSGRSRIAVSGAIFWPKGDPPPGGWPIVAWAHGTVGTADRCAPSFAGRSDRDVRYLNAWLAAGFAVVATDYQGLGTPGGHPYLAAGPEAYGVLDSVRAVAGRDHIGDAVLVVGQSQGAGAAFATAALAPIYAPGVKLRGTVATGIPYFSPETLSGLVRGGDPDAVTPTFVYTLLLLQLAEQTQPGFHPWEYLTERGRTVYGMVRTACFDDLAQAIIAGQLSSRTALAKDPQPALEAIFPLLAYPTLSLSQPLFVGTGEADCDDPTQMQAALVRDACAAGSRVVWRRYPGLDHSATVNASLPDSLPFARSVLAGRDVQSVCPGLAVARGARQR